MNITRKVFEEAENQLEELRKMELGTDQYKATVDGITKLLDRGIEMDKLESEIAEKEKNRIDENSLKAQQLEEERKDHFIKNCLTGVSVVGGLTAAVAMSFITMNFEKEGTFTTEAGRNAIRQLLRFK